MRKVKLALSLYSGKVVYLSIPIITLTGLKMPEKILKVTSYFSLFVLGSWLFLFGIILRFSEKTPEYIWFVYLILGVLTLLGLYLITVVLGGSKKLIDPKGFLVVLIFSLATTTASISVTPANISNTFGSATIKGLSGLVIMASLGLFYLFNTCVFNSNRLKWVIKFFVAGISAFVLYTLFVAKADEVDVLLLLSTLPIMLGALHYSKRYNWLLILFLIGQVVLILKYGFFDEDNSINRLSLEFLVPLLVAVLLLQAIYAFINRDVLMSTLSGMKLVVSIKKNWLEDLTLQKAISTVTKLLVHTSSLVLLVFFIYLLLKDYSLTELFENSWDSMRSSFEHITTPIGDKFNWEGFKILVMGTGAAKFAYGSTLVSNLIGMQGLLGIFAYLLIWSYGIWNGIALFKYLILKDKVLGNLLSGFIVVLVYIPLLSVFVYPTIGGVILWWISFAVVIVVRQFISQKPQEVYLKSDFEVDTLRFRGSDLGVKGIYLKYLICALVVVLAVFFGYSFLEVLQDLK